ncbi:YiaA/YiaB family inner membrane protein [Streptomonospora wellingtoniae]|uniref:YiaA/YiaB family inner membrane protein n=1 Tax=Streptomonospora wellingtoniae TaxID=3075544 RepID=A0ABU2KX92_9ACTN|nr:YiaA/YiaB family inner membrane protein [Streptomonospora sp. DSM 45055]MDT0303787.1 YiaA/YiaB family inner membrane protein [Streptomonospora sp. DSM 45055]
MSTTPVRPNTTSAFYLQSALSFGVSAAAVCTGIAFLPVDPWMRAFLALGLLYVITSAFALAKCVRDRQEETTVSGRVDQARLDKLLAEHDPFRTDVH